jgi:hypothetical protein
MYGGCHFTCQQGKAAFALAGSWMIDSISAALAGTRTMGLDLAAATGVVG